MSDTCSNSRYYINRHIVSHFSEIKSASGTVYTFLLHKILWTRSLRWLSMLSAFPAPAPLTPPKASSPPRRRMCLDRFGSPCSCPSTFQLHWRRQAMRQGRCWSLQLSKEHVHHHKTALARQGRHTNSDQRVREENGNGRY